MARIAPPLTERQAARIEPLGLLADEPQGLLSAWDKIERLWSAAIAEARHRQSEQLDARVNGEWSFIETLRHLVFVTDAWIRDGVLELPLPYDPIGLPPHFITHGRELGLDLDARPTIEQVVRVRESRTNEVRDALSGTGVDDLARKCSRFDGRFTVLGAFQIVIFEEWAHHYYAARDLAALT